MKTSFFDIIFPKKCVSCGRLGNYICKSCEVGLWEEEQICPVCRRQERYGLRHKYCRQAFSLDGLTCLWAYEGVAKKILLRAKYRFYYDLLSDLVKIDGGRPEYFYFSKFLENFPVITPVPLTRGRQNWRGFNQAEVIAELLAGRLKLAQKDLLVRTTWKGTQTAKGREERLKAVEGDFKTTLEAGSEAPEAVLLVDDVWTTGATLSECCKVLKKGGVKRVWGLVLAR